MSSRGCLLQDLPQKIIDLRPRQYSIKQKLQSNSRYISQVPSKPNFTNNPPQQIYKYYSGIEVPQQVSSSYQIKNNNVFYENNTNCQNKYLERSNINSSTNNSRICCKDFCQPGEVRLYNYYQKKFEHFPTNTATPHSSSINSLPFNNNIPHSIPSLQKNASSYPFYNQTNTYQQKVGGNQNFSVESYRTYHQTINSISILQPAFERTAPNTESKNYYIPSNNSNYRQQYMSPPKTIHKQSQNQLGYKNLSARGKSSIKSEYSPSIVEQKRRDWFGLYQNDYSSTFHKIKKGLLSPEKIQQLTG